MNKRIDLTQLGGFPATQYTLDYMQKAYGEVFGGLAAAFGNNVIISGCVHTGNFISDGWVVVNGEILPFTGGTITMIAFAKVAIVETKEARTFRNDLVKDVYYNRRAQIITDVGGVGELWNKFRRIDLDPWKSGDVKEIIVTTAYLAANFDLNGIGKNERYGWALLDGQNGRPDSRGRVSVGYNSADVDFNLPGKVGGVKTQTLQKANLPAVQIDVPIPAIATSVNDNGHGRLCVGNGSNESGGGPTLKTALLGSSTPVSIVQPYFVTAKIIKL